jgi:predicted GIY-YIG superfamily endonuclease
MTHWVYILASKPGGTLYVGVTNNLVRRVYEHREGLAESFTKRYGVKMLVYFEPHDTIEAAYNARRISNTGRASGKTISSLRAIPTGAIYTMKLSADADDGSPGRARR